MKVKAYPTLKVFIASPGDVNPERRAAVKAIEWVSDHVAKPRGWRVESLTWERDVLPGVGKDAQSVINSQIGEMREVSLFLLIMRDKFGTPTKRAGSGTEEEYDRAVAARKGRRAPQRPEISLRFGKPTAGADPKQIAKVEAFKAEAGRTAMWTSFTSTPDFRKGFQEYLTKWVSAEIDRLTKPPSTTTAAKSATLTARNALLLGERVYRCVGFSESGRETVLTLALNQTEEERALSSLRDQMASISFAYRLVGGSVQVSRVDFERDGKGTRAIVKVIPQNNGWSPYGHLDEASRMFAARRLLLGDSSRPNGNVIGLVGLDDAITPIIPPILAQDDDAACRVEARLRAVHALLNAGIVTEIERLDFLTAKTKAIRVAFSGRYAPAWGGLKCDVKLSGFVQTCRKASDGARKRPTTSPRRKY